MTLNEDWTVYVAGEMHRYRIKSSELAEACGYHSSYLSTLMNGNKEFSNSAAARRTREHVLATLEKLKRRRIREAEAEENAEQHTD